MKFYSRIQINNSFAIPGYVKRHISKKKSIVKWVINENNDINLFFIDEKEILKDYEDDECTVLYRRVHSNSSLSIPIEVSTNLDCEKYDCIEWDVVHKEITVKCFKKPQITTISGLFTTEEVKYNV